MTRVLPGARMVPPRPTWLSVAAPSKMRRPDRVVVLFALVVLLLVFAHLLGWLLDLTTLIAMLPSYATMKPNTAVCLGLIAFALLLQRQAKPLIPLSPLRTMADILLIIAFVIAALTLYEYAAHVSLGLDQLLIAVPADKTTVAPGRMWVGSAISIVLTSGALLLMDRSSRFSVGLLLVGILISISGLIGFLFQAGSLLGVIWFKSMAVPTAISLLLLQLGGLAARSKLEPFSSLRNSGKPDRSRAVLLLNVTVLPVLLALPVAAGLHAHLYDASFALSLLLVLLITLQNLLLWADTRAYARVQLQLRESEMRSAHILQSIGDAVIVTDASARVTRINAVAEQLTGWQAKEAFGRPLAEIFRIVHEVTRAPVESPAEKVMRLNTTVGLANHTLLIARDGCETAIDDSGAPVRREDGVLSGTVVIFRSVSERRQAEKALLESEKLAAVGRLAASIAHEINNPLESLTNLLYLARTSDDLESSQQYLDIAEVELRRVAVISNQTLRFHKQSTNPIPVASDELVESVLSMYQGRTHNSRVEVEKRFRARQPVTCLDGEIRQVLGNLIGNAIDALPQAGGRLLVRTRKGRQWSTGREGLIFTIADTGAGMSQQTMEKIFRPFFTTKGELGNGLGLWVSHEIVSRHDGSLRLRSSQRSQKCGTVFALFLPSEPSSHLDQKSPSV